MRYRVYVIVFQFSREVLEVVIVAKHLMNVIIILQLIDDIMNFLDGILQLIQIHFNLK